MGLMDLLQQVAGNALGGGGQHFDQIAQQASPDLLGHGLAEAFRSDQTPPFGNMVGQLFGQSNPGQQAGVLNQIIAAVGPAVLAGVAGGAIGKMLQPGSTQLTAEQASQLSPEQVREIAAHAEQHSPGVIDQVGRFYAEHPTLVKTVGGAALAIALAKMKDRLSA